MEEKITGMSSKFILIPYELITNKTINRFRTLVYSYLYLKAGMDNTLFFNTEDFKQYAGKKTGLAHKLDTYADKIISSLDSLQNKWFVSYNEDITKGKHKKIVFDKDKAIDYCSEHRFAIIYLDELETILSYKNINPCDNRFDNSFLLLVFLYLRANIPIRHNNRFTNPEAYNAHYKAIGEDIGISERMVSKSVSILKELKLIYVAERNPIKYYDNQSKEAKFRTPTNIFCNTYKRVKNGYDVYLMAEGESYYLTEVENKIKYLEKHKLI